MQKSLFAASWSSRKTRAARRIFPDDLSLPISTSPEEMAKHVTDVVISDPELGASVEWREAKYSKSPPVRILDKVREPSSDSITFDRGEPIQRLEEHLAGLLIWANRVTVIDQYMLHNLKGAKNFSDFFVTKNGA